MRYIIDLVRGFLIGCAEIVPGISGGTVGIIVGVYERVIQSADHTIRGTILAVKDGLRGREFTAAKKQYKQVSLSLLIPLIIGMFAAIFIGSWVLAPLLEEFPVGSRAVMFGLMVASLIVPIKAVGGGWKPKEYIAAAVAAILAFLLTGLPANDPIDPPLILVAAAAAVAVCALVLPGVSGSFLLLVFGLYAPTLDAVNERNFVYLGVFILGAILGLSLFVGGLRWLMENHNRITFAVASGLMVGSLRAIWPWQDDDRGIHGPDGDAIPVIGLMLAGAVVVIVILVAEAAIAQRRLLTTQP